VADLQSAALATWRRRRFGLTLLSVHRQRLLRRASSALGNLGKP
jgi:hypothetical protein